MEPLTAVRLVCVPMAGLPHVERKVDAFLLGSGGAWTLERASERGQVRLLDRLLQYEWYGLNQRFQIMRFRSAVRRSLWYRYDLCVLQWWLQIYMPDQQVISAGDLCRLAIESAQLHVLQWLHRENQGQLPAFKQVVVCTDPAMVYWLYDHRGCALPVKIVASDCSTESGFELIQWCIVHEDAFQYDGVQAALQSATQHGQLERLQWLHEHRQERCSRDTLSHVVYHGHLQVAAWLQDKYPKHYFSDIRDPSLVLPQPTALDLPMVQWVASEFAWREETARTAWVYSAMRFAAMQSKPETLESVYGIWIEILKRQPIQDGKPHAIALDFGFMDAAAAKGNVAMLQWIHVHQNQGCSQKAMDSAAANGHLDAVQWLHLNRTEGCATDAMDAAAGQGHIETVQWLHVNRIEGCTTQAMDLAAANGHLEVVQWLHENRAEGCTTQAMDLAAQYGHVHILEFLHANRHEGCTTQAMDSAAKHGHLNAFQWLEKNRPEGFSADIHKWAHWKIQEYMATQPKSRYCRVGYFIDRLTDLKQFGAVESVLREAQQQNMVSIKSKYVNSTES